MLIGPTLRTPAAKLSKKCTSFVPNVVAATHNLSASTTTATDSTTTLRLRTASGGQEAIMGCFGPIITRAV